MTRKELIEMLVEDTGFKKVDVEHFLDSLVDVAAAELLGGGKVPLPGIGKLQANQRDARAGRNPKTGQAIRIPARITVKFTAAQSFKDSLRG